MELVGEQWVAAPPQRVWEGLNDPEVLRASIPGCQSLDKEGDNRFAAIAEVRIGPIGARFKGAVTLSDLDPPNGYTITGKGNGGIAGSAKGGAKVRLDRRRRHPRPYVVDAEVGGRMAQLGGPIIDATAKQLAGRFFDRFGEMVGGVPGGRAGRRGSARSACSGRCGCRGAAPTPFVIPPPAPVAGRLPVELGPRHGAGGPRGFLLGRSAAADWWVVGSWSCCAVAAGAGYQAGPRAPRDEAGAVRLRRADQRRGGAEASPKRAAARPCSPAGRR